MGMIRHLNQWSGLTTVRIQFEAPLAEEHLQFPTIHNFHAWLDSRYFNCSEILWQKFLLNNSFPVEHLPHWQLKIRMLISSDSDFSDLVQTSETGSLLNWTQIQHRRNDARWLPPAQSLKPRELRHRKRQKLPEILNP